MAITKSRTGWEGTESADLDGYLAKFSSSHGTPTSRVVHAVCASCGGDVFRVELDDEEGCAARTCATCSVAHPMLDSAEHLDDAELEGAVCPCGHEEFPVAVGFAVRDEEVTWVFVSLRCTRDDTLGVYTDWKIDYAPTHHLLGAV